MPLEYKTYQDFQKNFNLSDRWEIFDGYKDNLNIAHECVDRHPKEKTAIRLKFDDGRLETYTFGELSRLTSQFANMLERAGVNAGDPVAIILNPSLEFYVSLFGTLKRGAVVVSCSPLFGPEAIEYRVNSANAKMIIIHRDNLDLIREGLAPNIITA